LNSGFILLGIFFTTRWRISQGYFDIGDLTSAG
jgi:hypothetical protein